MTPERLEELRATGTDPTAIECKLTWGWRELIAEIDRLRQIEATLGIVNSTILPYIQAHADEPLTTIAAVPHMLAENERLRRLEAALAKTKDGVAVVPGMNVFVLDGLDGGIIQPAGVLSMALDEEDHSDAFLTVRDGDGEEWGCNASDCYSTEAAAQAETGAGA